MKKIYLLLALGLAPLIYADTPAPGTVKAKTYSGDGVTAITATGTALNVNVVNTSTLGTVDQGAAGTDPWAVHVTSSALPTNAALEDGGNLQVISGQLAGDLKVVMPSPLPSGSNTIGAVNINGTVPVSGTFWQATQPVSGTVTANIGTTNGLALDASVAGLQVSQGSTTSGQKGGLSLGAVTTAAPTYTTAQSSPISLTTAGALRVDGSAATQPVSGTVTANAGTGTFTVDASGHTVPVSGTFWQATQPVSLASPVPSGTNVIGKVAIDQTTPGTTNLVALAANQTVNVAQINGITPLMGNGNTGTGSQRVTIAADNTPFSVNTIPGVPTAVTVKQAAITIGTSAVRLTTDGSAPSSTRVLLVAQLLSSSTANCYFGSSSVTSSSTGRGVQMFAGQAFSFNRDAGDYYAICDTSSQTFLITEQE